MSGNKKSNNNESINNLVTAFGKHFGPKRGVQMPAEVTNEKERSEAQLAYTQMIMGSMASLVWGVKGKDKETDIRNLLGKGNSLFNLVELIKKSITGKTGDKSIFNQITTLNTNINKLISDSLSTAIDTFSIWLSNLDTDKDPMHNLNNAAFELLNVSSELHTLVRQEVEKSKNLMDSSEELKKYFSGDEFKKNFENKLTVDITGSNNLGDIVNQLNSFGGDEIINKLNQLDTIIQKISNYEFNKENIKAINNLFNVIDTIIYNSIKEEDINKAKNNLKFISTIIDGEKGDLGKIFNSIARIVDDENVDIKNDISSLNSILQTIITIISIDPKSINLKGLRTLLKVSDTDNGQIKKLLSNLSKLTTGPDAATINNKNFRSITEFFDAISSIGDIGFMKRRLIKSNIKYFSTFIGSDIPKLIEEIGKASENTINSDKVKSINALANIFTSLSKIGELKFKDKIRMKINLLFIRHFIINDVAKLIKDIIKVINTITPEGLKTIDQLNNLFDRLFEIGKTSLLKFLNLSVNLSLLEELIRDQLIGGKEGESNYGILYAITGIKEDLIKDAIDRSKKLQDLFDSLGDVINNEDFTLANVVSFIIKLALFSASKKMFDKFFDTLNDIVEKVNALKPLEQDRLNDFNATLGLIEKIANLDINILKVALLLPGLSITWANAILVKNILEELNKINVNEAKVEKIIKLTESLLKLKGSLLGTKSLNRSLKAILNSVDKVKNICEKIKEIDDNYDVEKTKEIIGTFNDLVIKAAAILIIGGLAMKFISPMKLIAFAVTLGAFLWGITKVFGLMGKTLNKDIKVSKDAMNLVMISAGILILGGLVMNFINPVKLFLFAFTLSAFILAVTGAYYIMSKIDKKVFIGAKSFATLVVISTLTLIAGAIFMKTGLWKEALLFAGMLAGFIFGITLIYKLASKEIKKSLSVASNFALLIVVSAGVLILGSLFMTNLKRVLGALLFAAVLGLFIWGIVSILKKTSGHIRVAISTMIAISMLVAVAAATLLIGGLLMTLIPNLGKNIIIFSLILVGFITVIVGICALLKLAQKHIEPGIAILGGIIILIGLSAVAMGLVALVSLLVYAIGYDKIWSTLGIMTVVIGGMAFICWLIGQPSVILWVALGVIALGMMTIVLGLMVVVMAGFVAVIKYASTLDEETVKRAFGAIHTALGTDGLLGLFLPLVGLGASITLMLPGIAAIVTLSAALSILALTLKQWADLKIPIYEGNKIVGYKTLDTDDFKKAADNIKHVIICLFGAIKKVYDEDKDMFKLDWHSFLDGKNPVQRVISSSLRMGKMLSSIAQGVKAWSKLTIPEYDSKGKIIGYKTIDSSAFVTAGENIKAVITCLGQAIIDVYKNAPEGMFESNEWLGLGNTPFAKVTKAMKTMGPMLSSIAKGVQMWADLRIPIYGKDKNGRTTIIGYERLDGKKLSDAQNKITEVVTALAQGIINAYNENKNTGMFDDNSWHGFGDTPFARVSKSMKTMGPMLSSIAKGVQMWADLRIPIYGKDKDGRATIIDYERLDGKKLSDAQDNITDVVATLAKGIIQVYDDNKDNGMFDDGSWFGFGDSKFAKVTKSMKTMGTALGNIADAVQMWAELKIPVYGDSTDPTKITDYKTIDDDIFIKVGDNINYVVTTLAKGIAALATDSKYGSLFTDGDFWDSDSTVVKVLKSIQPMGSALKDIADAILAWSTLNIPEYDPNSKDPLKPVAYHTLTTTEIGNAKQNIKDVVRGLIEGIAEVYNSKLDGTNYEMKKFFDDGGVFGTGLFKGDSPIAKVLNSIHPMGKALKDIADAVKAWAELRIPIYGNNSLEPTGYMSIGGATGINTAIDNIKSVMRAMIVAVASVYYGKIVIKGANSNHTFNYADLFKDGKDSILANVSESMIKIGNLIKNMAEGISAIASLKIPVYGSKGKIIAYHNIENGDFGKVGTVIYKVLTAIGNAIIEVSTNDKINPEKNPNFAIAVEAVKASTDILGSIASAIGNFASGKFAIYEIKKNKLVPVSMIDVNNEETKQNIKENIISVIETIWSAMDVFLSNSNILINDETNNKIAQARNAIVTLLDNIGEIYKKINESNKSYIENKKGIDELIKKTADDSNAEYIFVQDLKNTLGFISETSKTVTNYPMLMSYLDNMKSNEQRLTDGITSMYNVITTLLIKLSKLANNNYKLKNAKFDNISQIIGGFVTELGNIKKTINESQRLSKTTKDEITELIKNATDIVTLLDNLTQILQLSKSLGTQTFTDLNNGINSIYLTISNVGNENNLNFTAFTSLIDRYILTINKINNIDFNKKLNILKDGILAVYTSTTSASNKNEFALHVETLKKYIAVINSIQLNKINAMTDFVNAMNELSNQLGSLDGLTNAIANRLTAVLYELVSQLNKADASINNAHRLQETRKKLINESLEKIRDVMDQHMIVEISQDKNELPPPPPPSNPGGTTPTVNSNTNQSEKPGDASDKDTQTTNYISQPDPEETKVKIPEVNLDRLTMSFFADRINKLEENLMNKNK